MNEVINPLKIALLLFVVNSSFSQSVETTKIRLYQQTFPTAVFKDIFLRKPKLDSIELTFDARKTPVSLILYSYAGRSKSKYFDLNFEGDKYILRKKYGGIWPFPVLPANQINYMDSLRQRVDYLQLKAIIYPDSLKYKFTPPAFRSALYIGNIKDLEQSLEKGSRAIAKKSTDTVLIFQAIVNQGGRLDHIGLIEGEQSDLSDFIQDCILEQGNVWQPMHKDGRPLRSLVDICIWYNKDGIFNISTSGKSRSLQIKDNSKSRIFY